MSSIFDFSDFYAALKSDGLEKWLLPFRSALESFAARPDGNLAMWVDALDHLPDVPVCASAVNVPAVSAFTAEALDTGLKACLEDALLRLRPWRKGPFNICDILIDAEWRSDLKWARVEPHISSLSGRKVLDVGCGNGYYLFRMAGAGAASVIGIDPSTLFLAQFKAIQKFVRQPGVFFLPVGFEDLPPEMETFDTVFSMGVFYHRRSPFDFLRSLKMLLKKGGELVIETMVIEGDHLQVLVPPGRYARMNNVWFIPSAMAMIHWLTKAGFVDARVVDICQTTVEEQRATRWMPGESFECCISPDNPRQTIEGLPLPIRAVFVATRP